MDNIYIYILTFNLQDGFSVSISYTINGLFNCNTITLTNEFWKEVNGKSVTIKKIACTYQHSTLKDKITDLDSNL